MADLRALLAAATPGPWKCNQTVIWQDGNPQLDADIAANRGDAGPIIASEHNGRPGSRFVGSTFGERPVRGANAALIVALVNAAPALLAVADALRWIASAADSFCPTCEGEVWKAEDGSVEPCFDSIHVIGSKAREALDTLDKEER